MPDGMHNVDPQLGKLVRQYHDCDVRSEAINDERAQIRTNVEKLGVPSKAFVQAVAQAKKMTPGERMDHQAGIERTLAAVAGEEAEIFGQADIDARDKRAAKRADKRAKANETPEEQERRLAADTARSDPNRGGASGKVDGKGKAKDAKPKPVEPAVTGRRGRKSNPDNVVSIKDHAKASDAALKDSIAAVNSGQLSNADLPNPPGEQEAGGQVLDEMLDRVKSGDNDKPVSQSEQSRRILEETGLDKPLH
jgi:hypothetical protein